MKILYSLLLALVLCISVPTLVANAEESTVGITTESSQEDEDSVDTHRGDRLLILGMLCVGVIFIISNYIDADINKEIIESAVQEIGDLPIQDLLLPEDKEVL